MSIPTGREGVTMLAAENADLRAALAAAEAKLADERRHADMLATRLRDVIAGEVGYHAAYSDIGLKDHAARRAAEVANG